MSAQPIAEPIQQSIYLTERDVINRLRAFAYERKHALKRFPHAHGVTDKLAAIEEILETLDQAALCINPRQAITLVLKTALNLHYIAPRATRKLYITWYEKVEALMEACRQFIGRRKQQ
jgi:hypothetical protein